MLIVLEPVITYFASALTLPGPSLWYVSCLAQAYGMSVVYLHAVPQMRGTGMAPEEVLWKRKDLQMKICYCSIKSNEFYHCYMPMCIQLHTGAWHETLFVPSYMCVCAWSPSIVLAAHYRFLKSSRNWKVPVCLRHSSTPVAAAFTQECYCWLIYLGE